MTKIEGEYVSIHDKIRDAHQLTIDSMTGGKTRKLRELTLPEVNDIEQIKKTLEYILERLTALDRYVRLPNHNPMMKRSTVNGESSEIKNSIKELENHIKDINEPML